MADWLDVPTHVLRFWESRFSQIKPVKRAGGRRYYRPSDMRIIGGVKVLLHDQGMTIRGVQKLFREEGLKHVSSFSPDLFDEADAIDGDKGALDQTALEDAARPAPAARSTRDASPDPIADDKYALAEEEGQAAGVVFRHTSDKPAEAAPSDTGEPAHTAPELPFVPAGEAAAAAAPVIPPTPDVPDTDPADNDDAHACGPGVAARLVMLNHTDLEARRETLEEAAARLKALLDRAS